MAGEETLTNTLSLAGCIAFSDGSVSEITQEVCNEEIVVISLNGKPIISQVATPIQLEELGAGFVISQGLARKVDRVRTEGMNIHVEAAQRVEVIHTFVESSGGVTGGTLVTKVESPLVIDRETIFTVISHIVSQLWERTGGAHCSVLFSEDRLVAKSSDIGRHNTVDKVIGHAALHGIDLSRCILGCTGRQPLGMIIKAANAGIPIVVSKAATTLKGVEQARKAGITLVCRVKPGSFCVYSHPERIRGILKEAS